jgi:TRAP transporter TAXI family solute receptor
MKKFLLCAGLLLPAMLAVAVERTVYLNIATGGTAGVYYPLGNGLAKIFPKYLSYTSVTAQATGGSVENLKLIAEGKADIAFALADTVWDGYKGFNQFRDHKVPVLTLAAVYPASNQIVTIEGRGINKVTDLKGRHVSTGAAGSGTEIFALRVLEAYGLDPEKDVIREKLGAGESATALKDKKIDAFFWLGGVPTAAVTDLASSPGIKIKLIDHALVLPKIANKYGPLYTTGEIAANSYPGQTRKSRIINVWNLLVVNQKADEKLVYDLTKTLFEKKDELAAVHKEAANLTLEDQPRGGSPIPFHPGARRYLKERNISVR